MAPGLVSSLWVAYTVPLVLTRSIHRCLPSDFEALTSTHLPSCMRYSSVRSSYSPCSSRLDEQTANCGSLALLSAMLQFSFGARPSETRSEEHTSELQSLMRISYAVFCLKKKKYKK